MLARLAAASSVAFILAALMVLGVAAPVQAIGWGNLDPRRFRVNMLASVMAAAGDTDWKRAIIAGNAVYDHSFEGIEAKFNAPSSSGAPKTATDYQLDRLNFYNEKNITSNPADIGTVNNTKNYRQLQKMPVGLPQKFVKAAKVVGPVVGPTAAITGWMYRADIGRFASGLVGLDNTDNAVCGYNDQYKASAPLVSFITGVNCDMYGFVPEWDPNSDVVATVAGWQSQNFHWGNMTPGPWHGVATGTPKDTSGSFRMEAVYSEGGGYDNQYTYVNSGVLTAYCVEQNGSEPGSVGNLTLKLGGPVGTVSESTFSCPYGRKLYAIARPSGNDTTSGATVLIPGTNVRVFNNGASLLYYAPGNPGWTPGTEADPERTLTCEVMGTDGISYVDVSPPYRESSGSTGQAKCPGLPDGVGAADVSVTENTPGGTPTELMNQQASPAYLDMYQRYPECVDGHCKLDLIDKRTNVSCFASTSAATACSAWLAEPNKTVDYQCRYGIHDVALNECYVYGDVFKPDRVAAGQAYTDPLTGLPVVSGQSSPSAGNTAMGRPALDPQDAYGCMGQGWAEANPIEWVLVPLQCSLQWAFVPSPTTTTVAGQRIATEWGKSAPGQLIAAVAAWNINFQVNGCGGVPFPFKYGPVSVDIGIPSACAGTPLAPFAGVVRTIGVLGFVLGSVMVLRKHAGSSIGFGG